MTLPPLAAAFVAVFLAAAILGAGARRLEWRRSAYLLQSAALATLLAIAGGDRPHLYLGALAALGLKCIWLPRRLAALARRHRIRVPQPPAGTDLLWLVAQGVLATLVHRTSHRLLAGEAVAGSDGLAAAPAMAAALAAVAISLLAMLRDRQPIEQFLGLLSLENGVALAAVAATSGRLVPFLLVAGLEALLGLVFLQVVEPLVGERSRPAAGATLTDPARS